jgi:hypothetical protein
MDGELATAMTETQAPPPARLLFRPDAFFIKPWRGYGVVRDGKGKVLARYETFGDGRTGSRSAHTEQTVVFDTGARHVVQWEIETDDEAHFYARDVQTGAEAKGRQVGQEFCWSMKGSLPTKLGKLPTVTQVTYTLVSDTTAFGFAEVRCFGKVISTYTTYYEQT